MVCVALRIVFTSWISTRRRNEDGVCRVTDGDGTHSRRLGDLGQIVAARVSTSLDHVDFDIFAHGVGRLRVDCGHCH
jgi:hypothetical protein